MSLSQSCSASRTARCAELLSELVAHDTANPMGGPYARDVPVERRAIETIEALFERHRGQVSLARQSCSPIHENLIVRWRVASSSRPALFESHIDTVPPAAAWADRAWTPRAAGDRLIGLGACDDKGCLTAMILALLELVEQGRQPPRSVVLVCAGDEEYAQTGIRTFLKDCEPSFAYGIFGEPTRLLPVVQHKGTVRWDVTVRGRSAHTSRPELGVNAILGMMDVIAALQAHEDDLRRRFTTPLLTGPTITVTQIAGGRTRNAVPDECTIAVDLRIVPGMDPQAARDGVMEHLSSLPCSLSHSAVQLMTPPLSTPPDGVVSQRVRKICREQVDERAELLGAPYGTDAAWAGDRCPALVLGPGDIRHAHAVDEEVLLSEVALAVEVYQRIMLESFEGLP